MYLQGHATEVKVESSMDVTVQVAGDHELSLAEFLDGCARVASETTSVVRSTLEDLVVLQENDKTNQMGNREIVQELPEKHGKTLLQASSSYYLKAGFLIKPLDGICLRI